MTNIQDDRMKFFLLHLIENSRTINGDDEVRRFVEDVYGDEDVWVSTDVQFLDTIKLTLRTDDYVRRVWFVLKDCRQLTNNEDVEGLSSLSVKMDDDIANIILTLRERKELFNL